jgi:hypothetical protein
MGLQELFPDVPQNSGPDTKCPRFFHRMKVCRWQRVHSDFLAVGENISRNRNDDCAPRSSFRSVNGSGRGLFWVICWNWEPLEPEDGQSPSEDLNPGPTKCESQLVPSRHDFESEGAAAIVHCWKVFKQHDLLIYNYVYISITILRKQIRENGNRNF